MPKGPRGEKRPADVIGNAVKVMRIATGEEIEELETDRVKSGCSGCLFSSGASAQRVPVPLAFRRSQLGPVPLADQSAGSWCPGRPPGQTRRQIGQRIW